MPNLSSHIQTFSVYDLPYAGFDMIFDSMDGYSIAKTGTSSITFIDGAWYAKSGAAVGDFINIERKDLLPLYIYTWDKRRQLRMRLESLIKNDPAGSNYALCGNPFAPWRGFGLVFTPTQIIARCGDGMDITNLVLFTGLTPGMTYIHLYEFIFYPGNGVYISVDGILLGSITTNLPSGPDETGRLLTIYLSTDTLNLGGSLGFSRIQFSQDK